ncbi:MAG: hypothetical protein RL885_16205 [Planctomycetota bacterium]
MLTALRAAADAQYRLSVREQDAESSEATEGRLVGCPGGGEKKRERSKDDFFREVEEQVAYTLLKWLVMSGLLEVELEIERTVPHHSMSRGGPRQ